MIKLNLQNQTFQFTEKIQILKNLQKIYRIISSFLRQIFVLTAKHLYLQKILMYIFKVADYIN